jgi:HEAT repeat protein
LVGEKAREHEERERQWLAAVMENRRAAAPIVADLIRAGCGLENIADLFKSKDYRACIPILVEWLPRVSNPDVKEDIVRALTVRWAKAAAPLLVLEFERASGRSLRWAIGNALSKVADDRVFDGLVRLVRESKYGKSREMVAVALGRMKDPRAVDVLVDLLGDDELAGHAIIGLGKLANYRTRSYLERFLDHPTTWIRKEATKAVKRIDKAVANRSDG